MGFLFFTLIFLLGLFVGSFLNVVVDRTAAGKSFVKGRSYCDYCKKTLKWKDLFPLISYAMQNGKCKYCHHKLSIYYPITELITGISFAYIIYFVFGFNIINSSIDFTAIAITFYLLYITSVLIIIFFIDLKYGIIPFKLVAVTTFIIFLWHILYPGFEISTLLNYFLSAVVASAGFLLLFLITKGRGMGFGDVIYAFMMGAILGFPKIILGLYIAFLSGALISSILILLNKKKMKGGTISFGPFLVTGTLISLFWGEIIINKIFIYLLR